jgi:hypothetical protein
MHFPYPQAGMVCSLHAAPSASAAAVANDELGTASYCFICGKLAAVLSELVRKVQENAQLPAHIPAYHPVATRGRTWSLPLPVAPWHTASAPTSLAISIWRLAISGLQHTSKAASSYLKQQQHYGWQWQGTIKAAAQAVASMACIHCLQEEHAGCSALVWLAVSLPRC